MNATSNETIRILNDKYAEDFSRTEDVSLLLRYPTKKWRKAHWRASAVLLSSIPSEGPPLARFAVQGQIDDLAQHIRNRGQTNKASVRISLALAKSQLELVEITKANLVAERKISRGTDAAAARHFADYMYHQRSRNVKKGESKSALTARVIGRIKLYRRILKNGK